MAFAVRAKFTLLLPQPLCSSGFLSVASKICYASRVRWRKEILIKESLDAQILGCGVFPPEEYKSHLAERTVRHMEYNHRLSLALLQVQDDAEALLYECYEFKKGARETDAFIAGIEELALKIVQRAREATA